MSIASRETPRTDDFEAEHRNVDDMTAAYAAFEFARTLEGELEAARQRIATFTDRLAAAERDAARYQAIRSKIGAHMYAGHQRFRLAILEQHLWDTTREVNLLKGSVAEHFDNSVDAALSAAGEKS